MKNLGTVRWLRTCEAASLLSVHPETLLRRRDVKGGYYISGEHYLHGPTANSPIRWNAEACLLADHRQGLRAQSDHDSDESRKRIVGRALKSPQA